MAEPPPPLAPHRFGALAQMLFSVY